jgi:hypothetical protein
MAYSVSQSFAQVSQFRRAKKQERDKQNHQQVHRLHESFKHKILPARTGLTANFLARMKN